MKNSRLCRLLGWQVKSVALGSVLVIIMLGFTATNRSLKAQSEFHTQFHTLQQPPPSIRLRSFARGTPAPLDIESIRLNALLEKMRRLEERLDELEKKLDDLQSHVREVTPYVD